MEVGSVAAAVAGGSKDRVYLEKQKRLGVFFASARFTITVSVIVRICCGVRLTCNDNPLKFTCNNIERLFRQQLPPADRNADASTCCSFQPKTDSCKRLLLLQVRNIKYGNADRDPVHSAKTRLKTVTDIKC